MSSYIEQDAEFSPHFNFRSRKKFMNRLRSRKITFSDNVKLIHIVSRLYGFTSFSFIIENGEILGARFGFFDFLWFIISLAIYALIIGCSQYKLPLLYGASLALFYEHYALFYFGLLRSMFSIIFDMLNRHRIASILIDFSRFDTQVRRFFLNFYSVAWC